MDDGHKFTTRFISKCNVAMLTLRCMLSRDVSDKLPNLLPKYHETAITFLQIFFTPSFNELNQPV